MVRRVLVGVIAALLAVFGLAQVAGAQSYPPGIRPTVSCSPTSPVAGQPFTCTATGFLGGTAVSFNYAGSSSAGFFAVAAQASGGASAVASNAGIASVSLTIGTPGTYAVTASGTSASGAPASATTTITVQPSSTSAGGGAGTGAGGSAGISGSASSAGATGAGATGAGVTGAGDTASGSLARTGSGNASAWLAIAGGAVLVGGLAVVAARTRRQTKDVTLG